MENNEFHDNSFNQVHLRGNLEHLTDHRASQNDHFKEVYQYPQSDWSKELTQRVLDAPYSHPKAYPGPGAPNRPQHVDRESYPEALAGQHPYTGPVEEPRATHTRLNKYKWLILLVVVIIVVGAAIGGALGGTLDKHTNNSSTSSSSSGPGTVGTNSTSTAGGPVLKTSNLAATNWTDNDGNAFHAVFWQSTSNHLIVSTFNGSIGNWIATNISSTASTTALPGTPLAAAVRGLQFGSFGPFGIALFYITPDNVLAEVYSTDLAARTWQVGSLSQSDVSWQAASGSQLAVRWDLCGLSGCSGDLLLAYEDEQQGLRLAHSSDWAATPGTLVTSITPSSPLAMTATDRIQPTSLDQWDGASSARLYFEELQTLQEWGWDDVSGSWYNTTNLQIPGLPELPPKVAAISFENVTELSLGPINIALTLIYSNGVILTNFYNNQTWSGNDAPNIQNTAYNTFTAGAMIDGSNVKFYGLATDGTLQSFTVDRANPRNWQYDPVGPLPVLGSVVIQSGP